MAGFGLFLLFSGFALILWGGAEYARTSGAGLPPGGCAFAILILVAIFRTKAVMIGIGCVVLGLILSYITN